MRNVGRCLTWALAATSGLGLVGEASAAEPVVRPAGVHRMEIYTGTQRTVRYFPGELSPGDNTSLRALERAENESTYVEDLRALRAQYASEERLFDAQRFRAQQQLYGMSITTSGYSNLLAGGYASGYGGGYGRGWATYPYTSPSSWMGGYAPLAGSSTTVTRSLANGVGEEGVIKDALAQVVARQATAEYAASVEQGLEVAISRAADSPTLRTALRLPDRRRTPEAFASSEEAPVVLTLKGGKRVLGREFAETKDWITVTTLDGRRMRIRPSEVNQIDEGKAVRPAGG